MKNLPVILGMLLAVSVLFNVVAFVRMTEDEAPAAAPVKASAPAEVRKPAPSEPSLAERPAESAAPGRESAPLSSALATAKAAPPGPALTQPSLRNDPKVREVLQANEAYGAFWKDIDRLSKVRSKFDEAKYQQSVLAATEDFLQLGDPARAQFDEAARIAANGVARTKKEHDAAKGALPPKDKNNPAALAAYEQQKDALDLRAQAQVRAAVDSLKPYLNSSDARHQEFLSNAEKWLRALAPKPAKP